jgi:hypothetical protein
VEQTRRDAEATEASVSVARGQIEMVKDQERARIEIKPGGLALERIWRLNANIWVRNLGSSRAYIRRCEAEVFYYAKISDAPFTNPANRMVSLNEFHMDPTKDSDEPISINAFFFSPDEGDMNWVARAVYEGVLGLAMQGIVEYGTQGTTYLRHFVFVWQPVRGMRGGIVNSLWGQTPPVTNKERISAGYWKTKISEEYETFENRPQKPN